MEKNSSTWLPAGVLGRVMDNKAGMLRQPGLGGLGHMRESLSRTRWIFFLLGTWASISAKKAMKWAESLRAASVAMTAPLCTSGAAIKQAVP
jgi:hypothetical protein